MTLVLVLSLNMQSSFLSYIANLPSTSRALPKDFITGTFAPSKSHLKVHFLRKDFLTSPIITLFCSQKFILFIALITLWNHPLTCLLICSLDLISPIWYYLPENIECFLMQMKLDEILNIDGEIKKRDSFFNIGRRKKKGDGYKNK